MRTIAAVHRAPLGQLEVTPSGKNGGLGRGSGWGSVLGEGGGYFFLPGSSIDQRFSSREHRHPLHIGSLSGFNLHLSLLFHFFPLPTCIVYGTIHLQPDHSQPLTLLFSLKFLFVYTFGTNFSYTYRPSIVLLTKYILELYKLWSIYGLFQLQPFMKR